MNPTIGNTTQLTQSTPVCTTSKPQYQHAEVEVILPELRVKFRGKPVYFTLTQLRLLLVFLEQPYARISSEELIRRLDLTGSKSLFTLICAVRKLLDQRYIHTCHGYGFRFTRQGNPFLEE